MNPLPACELDGARDHRWLSRAWGDHAETCGHGLLRPVLHEPSHDETVCRGAVRIHAALQFRPAETKTACHPISGSLGGWLRQHKNRFMSNAARNFTLQLGLEAEKFARGGGHQAGA